LKRLVEGKAWPTTRQLWSDLLPEKTALGCYGFKWESYVLRFVDLNPKKKAVDLKTQRASAPNMTAEDRFAPINDGCKVFWS
jgi:hypothetical protein